MWHHRIYYHCTVTSLILFCLCCVHYLCTGTSLCLLSMWWKKLVCVIHVLQHNCKNYSSALSAFSEAKVYREYICRNTINCLWSLRFLLQFLHGGPGIQRGWLRVLKIKPTVVNVKKIKINKGFLNPRCSRADPRVVPAGIYFPAAMMCRTSTWPLQPITGPYMMLACKAHNLWGQWLAAALTWVYVMSSSQEK